MHEETNAFCENGRLVGGQDRPLMAQIKGSALHRTCGSAASRSTGAPRSTSGGRGGGRLACHGENDFGQSRGRPVGSRGDAGERA